MGSIDLTAILEPLQFLLPHREPVVETLPTDTELLLLEEPEEVVRDSEKTEQLEEVEEKKEEVEGQKEEEEGEKEEEEMAHEEFSLE